MQRGANEWRKGRKRGEKREERREGREEREREKGTGVVGGSARTRNASVVPEG